MLTLHGITTALVGNFSPYRARTIMATPWVAAIGPLTLAAYHSLPAGSRKNFPKFSGEGKVTTDEHIKAFF